MIKTIITMIKLSGKWRNLKEHKYKQLRWGQELKEQTYKEKL